MTPKNIKTTILWGMRLHSKMLVFFFYLSCDVLFNRSTTREQNMVHGLLFDVWWTPLYTLLCINLWWLWFFWLNINDFGCIEESNCYVKYIFFSIITIVTHFKLLFLFWSVISNISLEFIGSIIIFIWYFIYWIF